MGLEQGRPQQFLMPDKGTGRPGGEKKPNILSNESKVDPSNPPIQPTLKESKGRKKPNILSNESKVDPSTSVTHPISKEHKEIFKTLDNK